MEQNQENQEIQENQENQEIQENVQSLQNRENPNTNKSDDEILDQSDRAIDSLKAWHDAIVTSGEPNDQMILMLEAAVDIFTELRRRYSYAIGHPQEVSGETLKEVADSVLTILKERLKEGTF